MSMSAGASTALEECSLDSGGFRFASPMGRLARCRACTDVDGSLVCVQAAVRPLSSVAGGDRGRVRGVALAGEEVEAELSVSRGLYLGFGRGGELESCAISGARSPGDRRVRRRMEVDELLSIADGVGSLFDEMVVVKLDMSAGMWSQLR